MCRHLSAQNGRRKVLRNSTVQKWCVYSVHKSWAVFIGERKWIVCTQYVCITFNNQCLIGLFVLIPLLYAFFCVCFFPLYSFASKIIFGRLKWMKIKLTAIITSECVKQRCKQPNTHSFQWCIVSNWPSRRIIFPTTNRYDKLTTKKNIYTMNWRMLLFVFCFYFDLVRIDSFFLYSIQ